MRKTGGGKVYRGEAATVGTPPRKRRKRGPSNLANLTVMGSDDWASALSGGAGSCFRLGYVDDTLDNIRQQGFVRTVDGVAVAARKDQRAKLVACNESGERVGEDHFNARLTNAQVDEIRDRYEAYPLGHKLHEGYRLLAQAFGVSKRTIRNIVNYERRNVWPAKWKRVTID